MKIKTETLSIRIDPKLKKAIARQAKKNRLSMSNYIAVAMTLQIEAEKAQA